ncbi:GNAT family N-acetyltransferase [Streptomyces sp. 796.1]|uniref:GNAT family N-acetyltransferase n=1 Tax=Streptomyces sp. 796.1 TaxID=3163029 RepID=UPI0039C94987
MTWTLSEDNAAFSTAAGPFLATRPDAHTLLISIAEAIRVGGADRYGAAAARYGWWRGPDGAVAAAFLWTPPHPLHLTPMADDVAADLATLLRDGGGVAVSRVAGQEPAARAFAARWLRDGGAAEVTGRQRLYRLGELVPPRPAPPGVARRATAADRALLLDWFVAYHRAIGEDPAGSARTLDAQLARGDCTVWEVDGAPVSMAGTTGVSGGMVRIGGVYTPDALRGRGYASALVAAVSAAARSAGAAHVLLFTDLANPTTNALYPRLGYLAVEDRVALAWETAPITA